MGLRATQKFSDTFRLMGRKVLKRISIYCTKCYEINTCHLGIQKHYSYEKSFKYYIFFVYRFTQKFSSALRPMGGNFLMRILASLYCTKCNECNIFFEMWSGMFYVQDHTKYFGYIMGYASKWLKMYF